MERWPGHQRYILIKDRCCAIGVVNPQLQQRLSAENIGWCWVRTSCAPSANDFIATCVDIETRGPLWDYA